MNTTPQNQDVGPQLGPDEARAAPEQAERTRAVIALPMVIAGGVTYRRRG